MIYRIADEPFNIHCKYAYTQRLCRGYLSIQGSRQGLFSIAASKEEIRAEQEKAPEFPLEVCESTAIYRKICREMLNRGGFVLHGSAIALDDEAYIFTATSGTGKSTHSRMWREVFGTRAIMVNDDKPIVKRIEDGSGSRFYAYGTPWCGKEGLQSNTRKPIRAICILERGLENQIEWVPGAGVLPFLLNQTLRPEDEDGMGKLLTLLEDILETIPFYKMKCNLSHEAAQVAYEAMHK